MKLIVRTVMNVLLVIVFLIVYFSFFENSLSVTVLELFIYPIILLSCLEFCFNYIANQADKLKMSLNSNFLAITLGLVIVVLWSFTMQTEIKPLEIGIEIMYVFLTFIILGIDLILWLALFLVKYLRFAAISSKSDNTEDETE